MSLFLADRTKLKISWFLSSSVVLLPLHIHICCVSVHGVTSPHPHLRPGYMSGGLFINNAITFQNLKIKHFFKFFFLILWFTNQTLSSIMFEAFRSFLSFLMTPDIIHVQSLTSDQKLGTWFISSGLLQDENEILETC